MVVSGLFTAAPAGERCAVETAAFPSILGLMNDTGHQVRLLLDRPAAEAERVGCHLVKMTAA